MKQLHPYSIGSSEQTKGDVAGDHKLLKWQLQAPPIALATRRGNVINANHSKGGNGQAVGRLQI